MKQEQLDDAEAHWRSGAPILAGRVIFEHLPGALRVPWAHDLLADVVSTVRNAPKTAKVLELATLQVLEPESVTSVVEEIRVRRREETVDVRDRILGMAENVAMLIANEAFRPAPFGQEVGWRVVDDIAAIASILERPELAERWWRLAKYALPAMQRMPAGPITFDGARARVVAEIHPLPLPDPAPGKGPSMSVPPDCVVLDGETIEREWGWVFFYQSRRCVDSGEHRFSLMGNGPIIVNRHDGTVHQTGSARPAGHYIDEYEAEWKLKRRYQR